MPGVVVFLTGQDRIIVDIYEQNSKIFTDEMIQKEFGSPATAKEKNRVLARQKLFKAQKERIKTEVLATVKNRKITETEVIDVL